MAAVESVEVRWFGASSAEGAQALARSLEANTGAGSFDARTDAYVVLPGVEDFGIKVRGEEARQGERIPALLELKGRTAVHGMQVFTLPGIPRAATGLVERWSKWSYRNAALPLEKDETRRVEVRKRRLVKRYLLLERAVEEVQADLRLPKAGTCEVTLLEVDGRFSWSAGVEAFPADAATISRFGEYVEALLGFIAGRLSGHIPLEALAEAASKSYPMWLAGGLAGG
jgi:hypothetical protein